MQCVQSARGRNFVHLAEKNVLCGLDEHIVYDDAEHRYTVDGTIVPTSVTSVLKNVLNETEFDCDLIISNNLAAWRRNPRSKYSAVVAGRNDEQAAAEIKTKWFDANRLGTALHKRLEGFLNGEGSPPDGETDVEWPGVVSAIEKLRQVGAIPFRTELSVFWRRSGDGPVVCAGQVDVLMKCGEGDTAEFVMIDLKRTDKSLSAKTEPYQGKMCLAPLDKWWANEHTKYSLQLSMYCVMLRQCTGIVVPPQNRFLLRSHPSTPTADIVACASFDAEAKKILESLA